MRFRPCIDIHNGKVKQIVGGSLFDNEAKGENSCADENFISSYDAGYYAALYKSYNLVGGHIILLNKYGTDEYREDLKQAELALGAFQMGFRLAVG